MTHSPTLSLEFVNHPEIDVILIGGRLYKHSVVAVGAAAKETIETIHADTYFMGVTGLRPKTGLTTGDYKEARAQSCCRRDLRARVVGEAERSIALRGRAAE